MGISVTLDSMTIDNDCQQIPKLTLDGHLFMRSRDVHLGYTLLIHWRVLVETMCVMLVRWFIR